MTRRYDSFVLRCWRVGADEQRVEIEHLQSAGRTRVPSLAAAVDWISIQCGEAGARASDADQAPPATAEEVVSSQERSTDREPNT